MPKYPLYLDPGNPGGGVPPSVREHSGIDLDDPPAEGDHTHTGLITKTVDLTNVPIGPSDSSRIQVFAPSVDLAVGDVFEFYLAGVYGNTTATARWFRPDIDMNGSEIMGPAAAPTAVGNSGANTRQWVWQGRIYVESSTVISVESQFLVGDRSASSMNTLVLNGSLVGWKRTTYGSSQLGAQTFDFGLQHEVSNAGVVAEKRTALLVEM